MKSRVHIWQAISLNWRKVAEKKFGQLPPGRKFFWQGSKWLKTSPLLAREEGADQPRMIPHSAAVLLLEGNAPCDNDRKTETIEIRRVLEQLQSVQAIIKRAAENACRKARISSHDL